MPASQLQVLDICVEGMLDGRKHEVVGNRTGCHTLSGLVTCQLSGPEHVPLSLSIRMQNEAVMFTIRSYSKDEIRCI